VSCMKGDGDVGVADWMDAFVLLSTDLELSKVVTKSCMASVYMLCMEEIAM
jgi:hypothetical protein